MGEQFHLKAGDTAPRLEAVLQDNEGDEIDLTGASVDVRLHEPRGGDQIVDTRATVVDDESGLVRYEWADGDTTEPGRYRAEFVVEYPSGTTETFPNDGYHDVVITQ